jgi:hypothetical protein
MPTASPNGKPPADEPQDLADEWRKLALYAAAAIDLALDASAGEANAILIEAATKLDASIEDLDRAA